MPTMSHSEEQRRAWHSGKRKSGEYIRSWFRRVIVKSRNFKGAYTPRGLRWVYKL